MPSSIQARLRLSPSRWASLGSVGSVTMPGASQPARAVAGQAGQEGLEPARELGGRQHAPHEVGLAEAGREEVLARGLVGERAVAVGAVEVAAARDDERLGLRVARRPRPVEHEAEGERGLRVLADADGPRQLRQPVAQARRRPRSRAAPGPPTTRAPRACPTRAAPRRAAAARRGRRAARSSTRPFALEVGAPRPRGCSAVRLRASARRASAANGASGQEPRDAREQPVAVHRGVPVVAAVEGRRQLARRARVGVAAQHVRDLVRVLLVDAGEGEAGEALGEGGVDRPGGRGEEGGQEGGGEHARS